MTDQGIFFKGVFVLVREATVRMIMHGLNHGTSCFQGIRATWQEARASDALPMIDGRLCALYDAVRGRLARGRHWCAPVGATAISHAAD